MTDERETADDEARRLVLSLGPGSDGRPLPDWLTVVVARHMFAALGEQAWRCPHADQQPAEARFAVAWKPGHVACKRCLPWLRVPSRVQCGGCGQTLPSTRAVPLALNLPGGLVFQAVGCRRCWGEALPRQWGSR